MAVDGTFWDGAFWREMKTPELIKSLDIAVSVLEERREHIDDWARLLLDIATRIIVVANERL
jgi:hypothetical protein